MRKSKDYKRNLIGFYIFMAFLWLIGTSEIGWQSNGFSLNALFSVFFTLLCILICVGTSLILLHKIKPISDNQKTVTIIVGYFILVPAAFIVIVSILLLIFTPMHF